jgi:Flp pilus assembly pilin Flp
MEDGMGLRRREQGQGLSEYALMLAFVALACIAILSITGDSIIDVYAFISEEVSAAGVDLGGPGNGLPDYTLPKSPANGSKVGSKPTLKWQAAPSSAGVDMYRIRIYTEGATTPTYTYTSTTNTYTVPTALPKGNYRWEVEAHNSVGWSGFSPQGSRTFRVK